jgi:hypothetical protein
MLPDHLVDLYEKSSEKLISHKHKVKFAEVLLQNNDAFARKKLDLGTCSMITHKIDTGGAKPINFGQFSLIAYIKFTLTTIPIFRYQWNTCIILAKVN